MFSLVANKNVKLVNIIRLLYVDINLKGKEQQINLRNGLSGLNWRSPVYVLLYLLLHRKINELIRNWCTDYFHGLSS